MAICLLESACALSAVDAGIWKIRIPTKTGGKHYKRRTRPGKRRFELDKAAVVAVQEDPGLLALRYRNEASKNRRLGGYITEANALALGRASPTRAPTRLDTSGRGGATSRNRLGRSPSPYEWGSQTPSRSPSTSPQPWSFMAGSPSPEPKRGMPLIGKSRWDFDVDTKDPDTPRHDELHLPPINGHPEMESPMIHAPSGNFKVRGGGSRRASVEASRRGSWKVELPSIAPPPVTVVDTAAGGQPVHQDGVRRGRSMQRDSSLDDSGDVMDVYHPFKQVRAALRRELTAIETKQELEVHTKDAELALSSRNWQRGSVALNLNSSLVSTVRHLLVKHLPRASDDVRRASMETLLKSEVKRRLETFSDIEPTTPASPKREVAKDEPRRSIKRTASKQVASKDADLVRAALALQASAPKDTQRTAGRRKHSVSAHRQSIPAGKAFPLINIATVHDSEEGGKQLIAFSRQVSERSDSVTPSGLDVKRGGGQATMQPPQPAPHTTGADGKTSPQNADAGAKTNKNEDPDVPPKRQLEHVWDKFVDDGSVHHDDMMKALQILGFTPKQQWVDQAFSKITKYTTIRLSEFSDFVRKYVQMQRAAYAEAFAECDEDKSGSVEVHELAKLLQQFGVEPMRHVLHEVFREVDADGSGVLNLTEFYSVMDILRGREGFSKQDHEALVNAFQKFDRDGTGSIDRPELVGILSYLGIGTSLEAARELIQDVDENGNGEMSQREFLLCMRKVRDRELTKIKESIVKADFDNSGTLNGTELKGMLESLGYFPSDEAIADAAKDLGLDPYHKELDFSELWQLLQVFRAREGFSAEELIEIEEVFQTYATMGVITTHDLDSAMREMGQELTFEVCRARTIQVDIDNSGQLDYYEFRKLARINRDCETRQVVTGFRQAASGQVKQGDGNVSVDQIVDVLKSADIIDTGGEPPRFLADDLHPSRNGKTTVVDFQEVMNLVSRFRRQRKQFCREHSGFGYPAVDSFRATFAAADEDRSGELKNNEMIALLDNLFPEMSSDPTCRSSILRILKEIDADGSGSLDFSDFLRLMRKCYEMQITARFEKEKQVLSETKFSHAEVQEFRNLFLACDVNGDQELSLSEFKKMIAAICPMGDKNTAALTSLFQKSTCRQKGVEGRRDHADFPEFLWLLHQLLDTNFGGIRELLETNFGAKRDRISAESPKPSKGGSNQEKVEPEHLS